MSPSFLEGPKAALVASKDFDNGHYKSPPIHGIRAFGRVYSAWAYGQTVSHPNQHTYETHPCPYDNSGTGNRAICTAISMLILVIFFDCD
jgi:hypothetical protein